MIAMDKPNPFEILKLPINATNKDIVSRGQELCDLAVTEEERLRYRWAMEQLITHPLTRLEYELFEMPVTEYDDWVWDQFIRKHAKNPINLKALTAESEPPSVKDFNFAALIQLLLEDHLMVEQPDITVAVDNCPVEPGYGPPPLEVKDVIFG